MTDQNTARPARSYDDLYPARFLSGAMMRGRHATLTITRAYTEELRGERGTERKAILSFAETDKELVLAKINGVCIKAMFGRDVQQWIGRRVTFWPTDTLMPMPTAKGDDRICVRVYGSPEIDAPVPVEFAPPRRKKLMMTMQPTGAPKAAEPERTPEGDPIPAGAGVEV